MSTEIRRARIKLLVEKAKRDEGLSQAQFAKRHGLDPTHLSQMLKSKRGIGNSVAMRLEDSLLLERGYLDRPLTDDIKSESILEANALLSQMDEDTIDRTIEFMRSALKLQALEDEVSDLQLPPS